MTLFVVMALDTGAEVYRYESDAPVEWVGMGFSTHTHALVDAPANTPTEQAVGAYPVSKLDYLGRFTSEELGAIFSAAKTHVPLEVWLEKFKLSEFIDLSDPRTLQGLQSLEAFGLINPGRAQEILNGG